MTVLELIEKLKQLPSDAAVYHEYDGETWSHSVDVVWLAKNGTVVLANKDEYVEDTESK